MLARTSRIVLVEGVRSSVLTRSMVTPVRDLLVMKKGRAQSRQC